MITIIFAPPRTGKTALLTHIMNTYAFDRQRWRQMADEIATKNAGGFNYSTPQTVVCTNYDFVGHKFGYSPRPSFRINPFRLGYDNPIVKTHFIPPYAVIGITEAQKYLNSRMSMYFPDWQSRWYEQHGHNFIDIFLDTQRPMLIDANIRELSSFIEVISLDKKFDEYGNVKKMIWTLREIENSSLFDKYMASGKTDKSCYKQVKLEVEENVFEMYDSRNCKPKFYAGHFDEDFCLDTAEPTEESVDGYIKYLETVDDELPKGFYQKRSLNGIQKE